MALELNGNEGRDRIARDEDGDGDAHYGGNDANCSGRDENS